MSIEQRMRERKSVLAISASGGVLAAALGIAVIASPGPAIGAQCTNIQCDATHADCSASGLFRHQYCNCDNNNGTYNCGVHGS